ncbi:hypothetical protein ADK33_28165 [Streptomyces griseus subsp. rhodochrous]|nr:hypothetical protein ADK33_28165 [Streptomyces griseus subsp. rhodochrous]
MVTGLVGAADFGAGSRASGLRFRGPNAAFRFRASGSERRAFRPPVPGSGKALPGAGHRGRVGE